MKTKVIKSNHLGNEDKKIVDTNKPLNESKEAIRRFYSSESSNITQIKAIERCSIEVSEIHKNVNLDNVKKVSTYN
jgi:hypothetical protein